MLRRFVCTASIAVISLLSAPSSGIAGNYDYLMGAANEIVRIDHASLTLSNEDAGRIAKIACGIVTRLLEDPNFYRSFKYRDGNPRSSAQQRSLSELLRNVQRFDDEFLRAEQQYLLTAGLDFEAATKIIDAMAADRAGLQVQYGNGPKLFSTLSRARDAACTLGKQAVRHQQALQAIWIVLGFAAIAVDVSPPVGDLFAAASVTWGVTRITEVAQAMTK